MLDKILNLETLLTIASTQSDKIGAVIGKSGAEVRGAIEEGKKMIPEIQKKGMGILKEKGVDFDFIEDTYRKYGKYIDKIPGISRSDVETIRIEMKTTKNTKETGKKFNKDDYLNLLK